MNEQKLLESLRNFQHFYLENPEFYLSDERERKNYLVIHFSKVFNEATVSSINFFSLLRNLFESSKVKSNVVWLAGGAFYQCQKFCDLLDTSPSNSALQSAFTKLLFSKESLKYRVNSFKTQIDELYKQQGVSGNIQLNLISQFLGLSQPDQYYIYKSTEFSKAINYFEFRKRLSDITAGGKYVYYYEFSQAIRKAMVNVGLPNIDYIDVQTFVYRDDWYTEVPENELLAEYTSQVDKNLTETQDILLQRILNSTPRPPKIARSTYYYRDPNLSALVKKLADGLCDLCCEPAPFLDQNGMPYLECHHIEPRSQNGKDALENVVALCPNCHRKIDVLNPEADRKKLIELAALRKKEILST